MLYTLVPAENSQGFIPLLLVIALAFAVPIVLARFRSLPVVVGEILAGIIIGPSMLGWLGHSATLDFLGDIGLAFLMFLAGLEIDLEALLPPKEGGDGVPGYLKPAATIYLFTVLLALPAGYALNRAGLQANPVLLFFVFSATSLGVLLPVLKESDLLARPFGQLVFLAATLADFLTVILFTIYILTTENGFSLEILSIGLLFVVFAAVMRLAPALVRLPAAGRLFRELSRATVQIKVRGAIAIMLAFVVLAETVNAELILGAFLAGMVISLIRSPEDTGLVHNLEAFGFGFFIPIFFILVGANLNLRALFSEPRYLLLLPVMLLVSMLVKGLPMLSMHKRLTWREMLSSGLLLNTHLSLEIAVVVIGERIGLVDAATSALIILFSALTVVLMPLLFSLLRPAAPTVARRWKLVFGAGQTARQVAEALRSHGDEVRFMTRDPQRAAQLRSEGYSVLEANSPGTLFDNLPTQEIDALLLLEGDDSEKLALSRQARQAGIYNVLAALQTTDLMPAFHQLGVQVYLPGLQHITMLTLMARNPDLLSLMESTQDNRDVTEITLRNRALAGSPLRSLNLPGNCLILSLRRGDHIIIPRGSMLLECGDRLTVLGHLETLNALRAWLESETRLPTHTIPSAEV